MATAKKSRSAVMALALVLGAFLVSGCSTIGSGLQSLGKTIAEVPSKNAPQASATATSASAGTQPVTVTVLGDFPTSKAKPLGKWETMHPDGFTGGFDVACKLLGLSTANCGTYKKMHNEGSCVLMDVPNGVVLDRLTFTKKNGQSESRPKMKVDLKGPPTRTANVCKLSDDVIAIRFLGCGNHALVTGWKQPLTKTVVTQPQVATATTGGSCPVKTMKVIIWEAKAATVRGVSEMIAATRVGTTNGVSRTFGATFRAMNEAGNLMKSTKVHEVQVFHHTAVPQPPTKLFSGTIQSEQLINLPVEFKAGDVIRVTFSDYSRLASPLPSGLTAFEREFEKFCMTNLHAIEAP
ncbi:MAG: hypothetical protein WAW13_01795 [Minisyncoccia bacterium]